MAVRNTPRMISPFDFEPPLKIAANAKGEQGTFAVISGGYAAPGSTALNLIAVGRFKKTVDNTGGAAGAKDAPVESGIFQWDNSGGDAIAAADVGKDCFIVDEHTVAKTDGGGTRSRAGKVIAVDADGVWVQSGIGL